eukprot:1151750-Pelagomonas_calceolata.AAC.7
MQRTSRHLHSPPSSAIDQNLQSELQQKTCSLVAVQRNYDVLSRVMQQKQSELDQACARTHTHTHACTHTIRDSHVCVVSISVNAQLKKEHDEESRRALSLGIKLDDALSRAQRAAFAKRQ